MPHFVPGDPLRAAPVEPGDSSRRPPTWPQGRDVSNRVHPQEMDFQVLIDVLAQLDIGGQNKNVLSQ